MGERLRRPARPGAVASPTGPTAFDRRTPAFLLTRTAAGPVPGLPGTGHPYLPEPGRTGYFGANTDRLRAIKRRYDPDGLFTTPLW